MSGRVNVQVALELTAILAPELHITGIVLKSEAVKGNVDPMLLIVGGTVGVGVVTVVVLTVDVVVEDTVDVVTTVAIEDTVVEIEDVAGLPTIALELVATLIPPI